MSMYMFLLGLVSLVMPPTSPAGVPTAPKVLLKHVPANARAIATFDVGAFGSQMHQSLLQLGKDPMVSNMPMLARGHQRFLRQLNRTIKKMKRSAGVDPLRDVKYITVVLLPSPSGNQFIDAAVIIGGSFSALSEPKLARLNRLKPSSAEQHGAFRVYFKSRRRGTNLAWSQDTIIMSSGPKSVIKSLLTPQSPSTLATWMTSHAKKPAMIRAAVDLSVAKLGYFRRKRQMRQFLSLFKGHKVVGGSLLYKGVELTAVPSNAAAATRAKLVMEGLGSLAKSGTFGVLGFLKLLDGILLPGDANLPRPMQFFAQQKVGLMKMLYKRFNTKNTHFAVTQTKSEVALRVHGKGSVALLMGGVFGAGLIGLMPRGMRSSPPSTPPMIKQAAPAQP